MALPAIEQLTIRHQFGQVEFATDQWFRLAASTLASATHAAGIATPAKPRAVRIRRAEIVGIAERMASLVVVLNEGSVKQALLAIEPGTTDDELAEAATLTGTRLPWTAVARSAILYERDRATGRWRTVVRAAFASPPATSNHFSTLET